MSKVKNLQQVVDDALNGGKSLPGVVYNTLMMLLVLIICVTFVIGTYPISSEAKNSLLALDEGITYIFLFDYLLRWWAKEFSIRHLFTKYALIDLISILPLFLSAHWQFIRVLRLFRVLRLVRMFQKGKILFYKVTELHLRQIKILFTLFCIVFIFSGMNYDVELQHRVGENFTFFDSVYFTVVSLLTVGYGDIVPLSEAGRFVALIMIVSGFIIIPWQLSGLLRFFIAEGMKMTKPCKGCDLSHHDPDAEFCKSCGTALT